MRNAHRLSLHALSPMAAVIALAVACGAKVEVTLGTNSVQSAEVAPASVSAAPTQCGSGSAHPNVCCTAGPNTLATCRAYPGEPFRPCDPDTTTYPDPRSCCDLDRGQCGSPPLAPPPAPAGQCVYGCPIGWYAVAPITSTSGACCSGPSSDPRAPRGCFGWGTAGSPLPPSLSSMTPVDAGASGFCDYVCPDGWQPLTPSAPDICCRSTGLEGGLELECFDQATGPASSSVSSAPPSLDGGRPSSDAGHDQ
jgi:hypothetical protein